MVEKERSDRQFDAMTSRLLRREALRRATDELNTMTGPGLEQALAQVSAEVTQDAAFRHATAAGKAGSAGAALIRKPPGPV